MPSSRNICIALCALTILTKSYAEKINFNADLHATVGSAQPSSMGEDAVSLRKSENRVGPNSLAGEINQDVEIDKAEFVVSLRSPDNKTYHGCIGTVIAPRFVVTAAHCVNDTKIATDELPLYVSHKSRYADGEPDGDIIEVDNKKLIPLYEENSKDSEFDIAILELKTAISRGFIGLPDSTNMTFDSPGKLATAYGWGNGDKITKESKLQSIHYPVVNKENCKTDSRVVTDHMICAHDGNHATCSGDEGAPLISSGVLIGVVSLTGNCESSTDVFTRVSGVVNEFLRKYAIDKTSRLQDEPTEVLPPHLMMSASGAEAIAVMLGSSSSSKATDSKNGAGNEEEDEKEDKEDDKGDDKKEGEKEDGKDDDKDEK